MSNNSDQSILGDWKNSYNSLMVIDHQYSSGLFTGTYSSTTGASGTYSLVGFAQHDASGNYPISIGIYWKSISGGTRNPTWHWVSMMCGQMITDGGSVPRMELLHGMVASTDYSDINIFSEGVYTETLVFEPYQPAPLEKSDVSMHIITDVTELEGTWKNIDTSSSFSEIKIKHENGFKIKGQLSSGSSQYEIAGLFDMDASASMLQSVVVGGIIDGPNHQKAAISFGGWLNTERTELEFIAYQSIAVPNASKYASVNVLGTQRFKKS